MYDQQFYDEQFQYENDLVDRIRSGLATSSDAKYLSDLPFIPNKLSNRVANGLATAHDADKIAELLGIDAHVE